MLTIQLKNLQFRAYHGIYPGEKLTGGDFVVNLEVDYSHPGNIIREIEHTLNYEVLFEMVSRKMAEPTPLLETIAMETTQQILEKFGQVTRAWMSIEKKHPPIAGLSGSVAVVYTSVRPG